MNSNSPRRQFIQQLRYRTRYFTGSRYDHCPFQVFSELFRADAFLKRRRCCSFNLNDGPVSNQCSCNVSIRQSAAHDEMIVAVHEYAYDAISYGSLKCRDARIGNRMTDRKMVYDLSSAEYKVEVTVHLIIVEGADAGRAQS